MSKNEYRDYSGKNILLLDGGARQVLAMIEGFHRLGCTVSVYCSSKLDVGYVSKYRDYAILRKFDLSDEGEIEKDIIDEISTGKYDLVVPMTDFPANILAKNKFFLEQYAHIYVNDPEIYKFACDKLNTMQVCMENNIPCPKTAIVEDLSNWNDSEWEYPLVVKPRSGYGAKGLSIVNNFKELELIFNLTEEKFGSPLVQEYIPQDGAQYQVEMIMDRNMKCKMFILLDKVRWYPLNGGSSTMNITLHNEKIYDSCINLLKRIGWRGYASLDLIYDTRSDTAKILEINPRINGTVKICFYCGIDVSRMIMQDVFENDIDENMMYQDGLGIRYFHMDILWFLKSKKRFKAIPSWFTWKHTVDEIFEWKNLKPGICYSLTAFKKYFHDRDSRFVK